MNDITLFSMFMLGILGTGHCIGMCGPLIFAFPAQTGKLISHLWYHIGRTLTYIIFGTLMGSLGAGLAGIASITGANYLTWVTRIQIGFSLLAAIFLIAFGLSRIGIIGEPAWMSAASPNKIPGCREILRSAGTRKRPADMFLVGILLGFLPCGLSYAAFARALASGGPLMGAILVFVFALGTVPGLLLLGTGASGLVRRYQKQSDILSGLLMIYMALTLGMDGVQAIFF
jgi:sulfite exporter TauE/SafE